MSSETRSPNMQHMSVVRTKPLMAMPQILVVDLGFLGIQYSFGCSRQRSIRSMNSSERTRPICQS